LVNKPKVLLLDEPLGALDLKLREEMQVELKSIQHDVGITFVFVTHDQGEALSMSSRVAVFNRGTIEQVGTPREIYEKPASAFVAGFVGTSNLLSPELSERLLGVRASHTVRPERIHLLSSAVDGAVGDVIVDGTVSDIHYLGAESRVRVRLDDGTTLVTSVSSDRLAGVAIERRVHLAWRRQAALAVEESNQQGEKQ
jgi:putative spermidine/putrescine transport system ATP-binding protein